MFKKITGPVDFICAESDCAARIHGPAFVRADYKLICPSCFQSFGDFGTLGIKGTMHTPEGATYAEPIGAIRRYNGPTSDVREMVLEMNPDDPAAL